VGDHVNKFLCIMDIRIVGFSLEYFQLLYAFAVCHWNFFWWHKEWREFNGRMIHLSGRLCGWGSADKQWKYDVRFEVFTAVTMKNGVLWVITPCGSWKVRTRATRHNNPEDTILQWKYALYIIIYIVRLVVSRLASIVLFVLAAVFVFVIHKISLYWKMF
jgi:hypothetical protein